MNNDFNIDDCIKYPRTLHLPFSPGATNDDKILKDISHFNGCDVVVTEKMDGENTTLYSGYLHARSIDSKNHPSRGLLKRFHASISQNIPESMRICGENVYAKHSIYYKSLQHHFLGFSIWDEDNVCLSFDETMEWFELLNITSVPILWRGSFSEKKVREICNSLNTETQEGVVVRLTDSFKYDDFSKSVAKFVRQGHVIDDGKHWLRKKIIENVILS